MKSVKENLLRNNTHIKNGLPEAVKRVLIFLNPATNTKILNRK